jgi:hypothetical protein
MNVEEKEASIFVEKFKAIEKLIVGWKEIYETGQKTGVRISISDAKDESSKRYWEAFLLLRTLTKEQLISTTSNSLLDLSREKWKNSNLRSQGKLVSMQREIIRKNLKAIKTKTKENARHAANTLHSKAGGSIDKQNKMRAIWATGKFTNRDLCAEQECAALGMSFSTARKALRNTPKPT